MTTPIDPSNPSADASPTEPIPPLPPFEPSLPAFEPPRPAFEPAPPEPAPAVAPVAAGAPTLVPPPAKPARKSGVVAAQRGAGRRGAGRDGRRRLRGRSHHGPGGRLADRPAGGGGDSSPTATGPAAASMPGAGCGTGNGNGGRGFGFAGAGGLSITGHRRLDHARLRDDQDLDRQHHHRRPRFLDHVPSAGRCERVGRHRRARP